MGFHPIPRKGFHPLTLHKKTYNVFIGVWGQVPRQGVGWNPMVLT